MWNQGKLNAFVRYCEEKHMDENETKEMDLGKSIEENQQAEFDIAKAKLRAADTIVDIYSNPGVRIAINSIKAVVPVIGDLIDESLCAVLEDNQTKKRNLLLDIILSDKQSITPDMVNDVEFIMNFAKVIEAVNRLARNEKVIYFANLIKNGYLVNSAFKISNDEFEEYFNEISRLSFRELEYLVFFWKYAENHGGRIAAHTWKSFSEEFNEKYNGQDPISVYRKLIKTGLIYEIKKGTYISKAAEELHLDNEGYGIDAGFKKFYEVVLDSNRE